MKRYLIGIIIILFALFAIASCINNKTNEISNTKEQKDNMVQGSIYINEKIIKDSTAFVGSTEGRLPFIQTIQSLGMIVEVTHDGIVHIIHNNDIYILQCSPDIILVKQGEEDNNLMLPPPGSSSYYCQYELGDIFLDSETFASTLYLMGVTVHISIDYTNSKITIIMPVK